MDSISKLFITINGVVWGVPMLILIGVTGAYLTMGLRFVQVRRLAEGFRLLFEKSSDQSQGDISPFNALMTSLSATIGIGNIVGVATAIASGGPGALFWMWFIAFIGMATKYAEAVLAVHYREVDEKGEHIGGPMYYIKNGLGARWAPLGFLFALFGTIAGFGIGNMVQSNSVAQVLFETFQVPLWMTGVGMMVLVALVLLGGIRRIAEVAGKVVPSMALLYLGCGAVVLLLNADKIPLALELIFKSAFSGTAASGGFVGATVSQAIRFGVSRGIFSNESGLGSAPIAHAAAKTDSPVRQGTIAMLGTFIDTIVVCSVTGLVIIATGAFTSGASGAVLSSQAFEASFPGIGAKVVALSTAIFALTTILGWSFYGEKCAQYLLGTKVERPYRVFWVLAVPLGAVLKLDLAWLIADTFNAMMAIPNLIALLLLSPVVFKLTRQAVKF